MKIQNVRLYILQAPLRTPFKSAAHGGSDRGSGGGAGNRHRRGGLGRGAGHRADHRRHPAQHRLRDTRLHRPPHPGVGDRASGAGHQRGTGRPGAQHQREGRRGHRTARSVRKAVGRAALVPAGGLAQRGGDRRDHQSERPGHHGAGCPPGGSGRIPDPEGQGGRRRERSAPGQTR